MWGEFGPGGGEEDRWGGDRACSVQGKTRLEYGRMCTWNITSKFVTLDVSKLSGWLNAVAPYRAERRAYDAMKPPRGGSHACSVRKGGEGSKLESKCRALAG